MPCRELTVALAAILVSSAGTVYAQNTEVSSIHSPYCFLNHMSPQQREQAVEAYGLRNPAQYPPDDVPLNGDRYTVDNLIWQGDGGQGASWLAEPTHLTYSFPDDGVTWGLSAVSATGPNNLNASFEFVFGAGNRDRGRELARQALASWSFYSGMTYTEVNDDNSAMDQIEPRIVTRGDIRIGGLGFGTSEFGAYNAFPSAAILGVGGADMLINTSFLTAPSISERILAIPDFNFRLLRNVISHEHGHGLGFLHQVPCDMTKLMEPVISGVFDMLQYDEFRAGGANYGDRLSNNRTALTAHDLGDLTSPVLHSVIETYMSTNGASATNGTNEDWYRFTISSDVNDVAIAVDPGLYLILRNEPPVCFGYESSFQFLDCLAFFQTFICPNTAGNLALELRSADGSTLVLGADPQPAGSVEFLFVPTLTAGTYTIHVVDIGPNPDPDQDVQLYDLKVFMGSAQTAPIAVAGIDKRIRANTNCFFMGDINSSSSEFREIPLEASAFDWDLDGDGTFETNAQPQPIFQYPSSGMYPVTLRVTDATTLSSTHTINVTVFGAVTSIDGVIPSQAAVDAIVPITITGTNMKHVANAGEFSVSGAGVTITGTPAPNALGTQVDGLSLQIGFGAATGPRDLTITNADGSDTLAGAIYVVVGGCPGDADGSGFVDFADITEVLSNWLSDYTPGTGPGDANGDGVVNFGDITTVLSAWLMVCP